MTHATDGAPEFDVERRTIFLHDESRGRGPNSKPNLVEATFGLMRLRDALDRARVDPDECEIDGSENAVSRPTRIWDLGSETLRCGEIDTGEEFDLSLSIACDHADPFRLSVSGVRQMGNASPAAAVLDRAIAAATIAERGLDALRERGTTPNEEVETVMLAVEGAAWRYIEETAREEIRNLDLGLVIMPSTSWGGAHVEVRDDENRIMGSIDDQSRMLKETLKAPALVVMHASRNGVSMRSANRLIRSNVLGRMRAMEALSRIMDERS